MGIHRTRNALACGLVGLATLGATTASATTIGATGLSQSSPGGTGGNDCLAGVKQLNSDPFSVVPPGGGRITSFFFLRTVLNAGQHIDFLVLRHSNAGDRVVGKSGIRTIGLPPLFVPGPFTVSVNIAVQAGDFLAMWTDGLNGCTRTAPQSEYSEVYEDFNGDADPSVGQVVPGLGLNRGKRLNESAMLAQPAAPPFVSILRPPAIPATYTQNQPVAASYSCTAGAGGTLASCVGTVPNGGALNTATLGQHSFTVTATDTDTQTGTLTRTYNVVAAPPPVGPPTVTLTTPDNGETYAQNAAVTASYSCAAGVNGGVLKPGATGCTGSVPSGGAVDTTTPGPHTFTVTATDTDGQTATVTAHYQVTANTDADTTPPSCHLTWSGTNATMQNWIQVTAQDPDSGIRSIEVVAKSNTLDGAPTFTVGTKAPVQIRANGVVPLSPVMIQVKVTDMAGNSVVCDPAAQLMLNLLGAPTTQTFTGIAQSEHLVHIHNGDPGSSKVDLNVNGVVFEVGGLTANAQRTVDIASALHPGTNNAVTATAFGPALSTTLITIADS